MKKSKFLKKSLAMLLAVMLVVAMIPLSAAAAASDLREIKVAVDGGTQAVKLTNEGDGLYTADVPELAQEVELSVYTTSGYEVYYTNSVTSTTTEVKATQDDSNANKWDITLADDELNRYVKDGVITVGIVVVNKDNSSDKTPATIELTKTSVDAQTEILEFTVLSAKDEDTEAIPQLGDTVIAASTVDITVPYDVANNAGAQYYIDTMVLSDYASAYIDGTELSEGQNITHLLEGGKAEIVVENQGSEHHYNLTLSPATGFKSFEIEEALDTIVFPDGIIVAMLPYGYTEKGKPFSVTANFELDYPSSTATGEDGALNSGDKLTMDKTVYGHGKNESRATVSNDVFVDFAGKTGGNINPSWNVWKADKKTGAAFTSSDKNNPANGYNITVKYTENTSRTYTVYFYEPKKNGEAYITELQIGSESVEVAQDAEEINITLPMNTKLGSLNTKGTEVKVTGSKGASITIPSATSPTFTCNEGDRVRFTSDFTVKNPLNASDPVEIKVVSEDGVTENWYTLNVDCADDFVMPEIISMKLTSADGKTEAIGQLRDVNGTNVYVFDVPYSIQTKNELIKAGWKLFYNKSIGATATVYTDTAREFTMPKSGAAIDKNSAFIPATFGDGTLGASIDLKVTGAEESVNSASYQIQINWKEGGTVSTIDKFDLYGTTRFADVNVHNTYKGVPSESDGGNSIDVLVNWTDYATHYDRDNPYTTTFTLDDANAKAFIKNAAGKFQPLVALTDSTAGTQVRGFEYNEPIPSGNHKGHFYNQTDILVLSEQAWVDFGKTRDFTVEEVREVSSNYTLYTLNIEQAPAGVSAKVTDLKLVDGTGWEAPVQLVQEGDTVKIVGEIPYALTSTKGNLNPVYVEFDIADDGLLMGIDKGFSKPRTEHVGTQNHNAGWDIPTGYAIFSDIAEYLDENKEYSKDLALSDYRTDHPYLIIYRELNGTRTELEVKIFKGTKELKTVESDALFAVSENGLNFQRLNLEEA